VATCPEEEICQVVSLPVKDVIRLTRGAAELAGVGVGAELWMEVRDSDLKVAVLVTKVEAVAALQVTVVDLWIRQIRISELWIRRLAPELREAGDTLGVQPARDARIRGDVRNVEVRQQIIRTEIYRALAARGPG
jgi:hypothetical protein